MRSTRPDLVPGAVSGSVAGDEQRVLHLPRGVVGRDVERVEVVPLGLDLGPLGDLVAHRDEHVGQPVGDHRDRVPGARRRPVVGQRDVDPLGDQDLLVTVPLEFLLAGGQGVPDARDGGADAAPGVGLGLRRKRADLGPRRRQRRPVARVRQPGRLELVQVARGGDRVERSRGRGLDRLGRQRGHRDRVIVLIWCGHVSLP